MGIYFSQPTWVGIPHHYFGSLHLSRCIVPVVSRLLHNIAPNAKYFIQPPDLPLPLTLDWDDKNLPEQVVEARGFNIMLYVSFHNPSFE